MLDSWSILLLN